LMEAEEILLAQILQSVHNRALELSQSTVKIVASTFHSRAATIGAATLVFNEVFQKTNLYPKKEAPIT
jgi:hypothetical protein